MDNKIKDAEVVEVALEILARKERRGHHAPDVGIAEVMTFFKNKGIHPPLMGCTFALQRGLTRVRTTDGSVRWTI